MFEIWDEPKKIKIRDIKENLLDKGIRYIQRFEYGYDDNWVTAVVTDFKVNLRYSYFVPTHITLGECYQISLETDFKFSSDIKQEGFDKAETRVGFNDIYVKTLDELFDYEIEVDGVYKEDK